MNTVAIVAAAENELNQEKIFSVSPEARRSLLEAHLRQKVGKTLKVFPEQIDPQQPLVAMGLDSLAAVELQSSLQTHWKVELSLENLLGGLTLEKLIDQILDPVAQVPTLPLVDLVATNHNGDLPLSFDQELLWLLDQMQPGNPVYNIPVAIRINGNLDLGAMQASLNDLVQRHKSLRTVFIDSRGRPSQKIIDAQTISLPLDDLSALTPEEQGKRLT